MDWQNTDFSIIGAVMYANDRWMGEFSSHEAAKAALTVMRNPAQTYLGHALAESDLDLLAAIVADEV